MNRRNFVTAIAAIPVLAPGCRRTEPPDEAPFAVMPGETFDLNGRTIACGSSEPVLHGEIVPSPKVSVMAGYDRQAAEYEGCRFINCTIETAAPAPPAVSVYWPET